MIDKTDPTNRDTVPAMLTPGEFVLNKEASTMFAPVIEQMNSAGLQHRAMKNMGGGIQNYNDGSAGGVMPNSTDAYIQNLLNTISEGEGGTPENLAAQEGFGTTPYDMVLGFGSFGKPSKPLSQMSMREVYNYQKELIKNTKKAKEDGTYKYDPSSAVGKYQTINLYLFGKGGTPDNPAKNSWMSKAGLDADSIYNAENQEKVGRIVLNESGFNDFKQTNDMDQFQKRLSQKWASVANPETKDGSYGQRIDTFREDLQPHFNNLTSSWSDDTPAQPTTQTVSAEPVPRFFSGGGADGEGSFGKVGDFFGGLTTPSVAPMASIPPQMRPKDLAPQMAAGTIDTMASSRPQMRPNTQADPVSVEQAIMQASVPQVQAAPPAPTDFGEAFKGARADMGAGGIFNFRGRDYTTDYAEEKDMVTANMGGSIYLNTGGLSIDQMARRKLQEDVDNAWFKRNERDALTKFDQANLALQAMPQSFAAPSPMQTDMDQLPRVLPGNGSQQEPSMADQGGPNMVPPMSPPMPDVNSDESLLQGSSGNVDQAFKFKQLRYGVPKPGQGYGVEAFGPGNIFNNGQTIPEIRDPRELGGTEGYGQTGDATSRRAEAQRKLIAMREGLIPGSPEHIRVSNLITGAFTPSMTSLDELINYGALGAPDVPAYEGELGGLIPPYEGELGGGNIPNLNPAANLDVGHPDRVAAIEAGTLEPTDADFDWEENQMRLTSDLQRNRLMQSVADEYGKTVGGDGSLKSEEQRLAAQLSGVPFIDYPPIESANIAGNLPPELTEDAVIASGLPQAKTNPTVILQVANQRQTAEDAIEQAKRDLATAEAGIRNAATAEQVAKYEEMGRQAKTDLTTSSADLVEAQEQQIEIDKVDAAAEADKSTLIRTSQAQADAAREAALSSLGFSKSPEKKGPGSTKGPMIKTGPNGTILDANGKAIVNLTPQEAITADAAAIAKAEADRIANEDQGQNTPEVSGAMSMLKGVFGDLFDSKELIRAAVMYLGGRATGMSGNQALAFAGKNYIARTDAKTGTYQKVALEGKHTKDSLAVYKKTMNPADLVSKGQPAIETGDYKDVYHTKSGAPVKLIEKETSTGRKLYFYEGKQVNLNDFTTDGRYSVGSKDHDVYVGQLESDVISQVKELHEINMTDGDSDGKGSKPIIGITPTGIATQAAKYVIKNQLPREVMRDLVSIAYQDAMAEKMSTGKTPSSLEPFFERAYVKSKTSNVVNFTLGNGKPAPAASVNQFFGTIRDMATAAEQVENPDFKLSSLNDTQLSTWLLQSKTYTSWNQITDPEEKKDFVDRGAKEVPPRSGFMQYVLEGYPKTS